MEGNAIFCEAVKVHDEMIRNSFVDMIDNIIDSRLKLMKECGINGISNFYSSMSDNINDTFREAIEEYFELPVEMKKSGGNKQ